ncbi:LysM peptidoglycan-binding domain-containing protein [Enterococcus sp. AZ126]|uniref:LysM peptidoglycan-binding domain-containing protein n=1 Tax=Enterococcus sp. AZ126 TaxID=2774635 RepID=UPI003F279D25
MKKRINKKYSILLVFSAILFSTAIYFMSSSLVLGASAGGTASAPVTADGGAAIIPAPTPPATQAEPKQETATENTIAEQKEKEAPKEVYVVKDGQTLWEIAQDSGLSIQTLMNKNQLSSSVIVEGQELVFDQE